MIRTGRYLLLLFLNLPKVIGSYVANWPKMNYPAASSEASPKDEIYFIVASDRVLNPQCYNKGLMHS